MAHVAIYGMTESGKTTLAKKFSEKYLKAGNPIIILDPLNDPSWPNSPLVFKTDNPQTFLSKYWASRSCYVFIDESGDVIGRYNDLMIQTATKGRHCGHVNHYITQRAANLSKTVRDQCGYLALFTSSRADGKIHADEWNRDELANCNTLRQGEFYFTGRYSDLRKLNVFTDEV